MHKLQYFILGLVCFFPTWIFKSGFSTLEIFILFLLFFLFPLFIHNKLFKNFEKKNILNKKIYYFYLSLVFTYSLDQNFGLLALAPHVPNLLSLNNYPIRIYVAGAIIFFSIFLIILLLNLWLRNNSIKILTVFTLSILILNLFDGRNSYTFHKFNKQVKSLEIIDPKNNFVEDKTLVIILDEMSGVNSFESNKNLKTKKKIINFFDKYNFTYYENAFSLNQSSRFSIPMLLNFKHDENQLEHYEFLRETEWIETPDHWLSESKLKQNSFFNLFEKITVFQSMHLDFCNHKNVVNCLQYNPFKRDYKYMDGVLNPKFSRIISLWKIQGSIVSNFVWRSLREFSLMDNTLEPYGQKMIFEDLLNKVKKNLAYDESDLVFAHVMVPHTPYGYNSKCQYDGKRSMRRYKMTELDEANQHNIERECVIKYLSKMFDEIDNLKLWENLNVVIFSDHGARISVKNFKESYLSSIFAVKLKNVETRKMEDNVSIQYLFSKYFNQSHEN